MTIRLDSPEARRSQELIRLSVADPGFDTPSYIKEALSDALSKGYTHYSGTRGLDVLRKALAEFYSKNYSVQVDPELEILPTNGAGEALFIILHTFARPGGEVIVPDPSYHGFLHKIPRVGLKTVFAPLSRDGEFRLNVDSIRRAITDRTQLLFLCNPNNPTGVVYSRKELDQLASVLRENRHVKVILDECYSRMLYDDTSFYSLLQDESLRDQVIVVNTFSKTYAMTGWRLGWIIAKSSSIDRFSEVAFDIRSSVNTAVQYAGAKALSGDNGEAELMRKQYDENRKIMISHLRSLGVRFATPMGGFEIFGNFSSYDRNSVSLKKRLEVETRVQTVAGSEFGPGGEGYLRLVFCISRERLVEGLQRIETFLYEKKLS
jgi:aspartate/methionine/tyrosine aminotransferase